MSRSRTIYTDKYVDVRFVGIGFHGASKKMMIQARNAMVGSAEWVLRRSNEMVPYDTGDLQESGIVSRPATLGETFNIPVIYGTGKVLYASAQHERDYVHRNGRVKKYLFRALKECMDKKILQMNVKNRWKAIAELSGR